MLLRTQGVFSLREVRDLYLEPGGTFSVKKHAEADPVTSGLLGIKSKDQAPSILLIEDGDVKEEMLRFVGKTKEWLHHQLEKDGYYRIDEILYGEWSETDGFYIQTYI